MDRPSFDVNEPNVYNGNYFGFPYTAEQSELVIISIPWDVTTSYGSGTAEGPQAMIKASLQMDLYDVHYPDGWKHGIATIPVDNNILVQGKKLREDAERVIKHIETGGMRTDSSVIQRLARVNAASADLNRYVYDLSKKWMSDSKIVAVVGGEHSVPQGLIKAVAEEYQSIGILQIDAHADLRAAYEGFTYSHASIMYNVMRENRNIGSLVQVALRDFCEDEVDYYRNDERIHVFMDNALSDRKMRGENWDSICTDIVENLPEHVYVSFDIDGLSPDNCPNTGTPVPGGLSFNEAVYLLAKIVDSGHRIVGFDLCEVAPGKDNEWDANVGARILYKLCNLSLKSKL